MLTEADLSEVFKKSAVREVTGEVRFAPRTRVIPVSVEPYHLFRYLDEQAYRHNNRNLTDAERLSIAVTGIVGKRVTWDQLTGKKTDARPQLN